MQKNMYEVFDEFEAAKGKNAKKDVIQNNLSQTLYNVLLLTYHPNYQFMYKEMPDNYKVPDTLPGVSYAHLGTELRRVYLFMEGHPSALAISEHRRKELFIQLLESLEPREAEVIMGIFNKDQGVKGLTYKFVKECFPQMLP